MSAAREAVLQRVRAALGDGAGAAPEPTRDYVVAGADRGFDVVERFCERVADYEATLHRVDEEGLEALLASRCQARGAARVGVPPGAPWAAGAGAAAGVVADARPARGARADVPGVVA